MKKVIILFLLISFSFGYCENALIYPNEWKLKSRYLSDKYELDIEEVLKEEADEHYYNGAKITKIGVVKNYKTFFFIYYSYLTWGNGRGTSRLIVISEKGHYLGCYRGAIGSFGEISDIYVKSDTIYFPSDPNYGNTIIFKGELPSPEMYLDGEHGSFDNSLNFKWERVIELEREGRYFPEKSDKENIKGERLYGEKKYEEAMRSFRRAVEYSEVNNKALFNLGLTLIKLKEYKEAIKYSELGIKYSTASEKDKKAKGMGYYNIGLAYEGLGNKKEALKSYETSLEYRENKRVREKVEDLK